MEERELAHRMMMRFEGYMKAYGSYNAEAAMSSMLGGKVEIKSTASTKRLNVTDALWLEHIRGRHPLGIIPIRDNNTCIWGCIDIDQYDVDIPELMKRIKATGYPLIVCGSKSGGAHLFLFMAGQSQAIDAQLMRLRLGEIAANLRYGGSEIFPKQNTVKLERGDLGTWLNMPYFGETRWAYREDGSAMPLEEFLDLADRLEQPALALKAEPEKPKRTADGTEAKDGLADFKDGPPCMQFLSSIGLGEGSRNTGIFAMGIFAKKKYGTHWEEVLERWNHDIAQPALPSAEMIDIIKRLRQKEYFYPCKDQPIVAHCNSALCRTRRHGVASGGENVLPIISGISVLLTEPPLWFLDVGNERLELSTDQLLNYRLFQKVCAERTVTYYQSMPQKAWDEVISNAMREAHRLEVTEEIGLPGQFEELLDDFVNDQYRAKVRDEIVGGKPWFDDQASVELKKEKEPYLPRHFFRLRDLQKYLNEANFKVYNTPQITIRLKALKGGSHFFKIKEKGVNVWWVPADFAKAHQPIATAPLEPDPI